MLSFAPDKFNKVAKDGFMLIVHVYHSPTSEHTLYFKGYDFVVTTYRTVHNKFPNLIDERKNPDLYKRARKGIGFRKTDEGRLIATKRKREFFGEAHTVNNRFVRYHVASKNLRADDVWSLTGAPIINTVDDLRGLFILSKCVREKRVLRPIHRDNNEST